VRNAEKGADDMTSYDNLVSDVVMGVESFGAAIMVIGGLVVFVQFSIAELLIHNGRVGSY
jgi:hypothetical protein